MLDNEIIYILVSKMAEPTDIFRGLEHIEPSVTVSPERLDYLGYFTNARFEVLLEAGREPNTITGITKAIGNYDRSSVLKAGNLLSDIGVVTLENSRPRKLEISDQGVQVVADLKTLPKEDIEQRITREKQPLRLIKDTGFVIADVVFGDSQLTAEDGTIWFRRVFNEPGVIKELTHEVGNHAHFRDRTAPTESNIFNLVGRLAERGVLCKKNTPNTSSGPEEMLGNVGLTKIGQTWHRDVVRHYEAKEAVPINPDDQIDQVLEMAFEIARSPGEDVDLGFVDITDLVCMSPQAFAECRERVENLYRQNVQQVAA